MKNLSRDQLKGIIYLLILLLLGLILYSPEKGNDYDGDTTIHGTIIEY